jgi:N,N'-diacetyllegionaminate synthase
MGYLENGKCQSKGEVHRIIIAEIGSVHDGSFGNACKLIEAAAECGADAVKFQTHIAEAETLANAPAPSYFSGEPRMAYFRRTAFSEAQHLDLAKVAQSCGVQFLSSPFSNEAVDLLDRVGIDIYKIPSGEVTNLPMLELIATKGRPVIVSSGMSTWKELDAAIAALKGVPQLAILQCSSCYPCPPEKVGLNIVHEMRARYGIPVGLSDHTLGVAASIAAAAQGATIIEKHFTFSRRMYGSDAKHSMEPEEFRVFTKAIRDVWSMLDNPVDKSGADEYAEMKRVFEKSVVLACDIAKGTQLKKAHLAFKKPGTGIRADLYPSVVGRKVNRDLPADHLLSESDFV